MSSTIITDYVGRGTHAARPVSPPISSGAGAFYYETDTGISFTWTGSTWIGFASGTVSSVAMTVPGELNLSGSPITASGTLGLSWANQTGNVILASPSGGGSGTPGFRNLVPADIPNLDTGKITTGTLALARLSGITTTQLSVTAGIIAGQIASIPNQNASIITAGTLATARGGTGVDSSLASNGALLVGTGTGFSLATLTAGSNITITNTSGNIQIDSSNPGGTVTSVSLTAPSEISIAGSPVISIGTIALTWANQTANKVLASPNGSTGTPGFRALVADDIPSLDVAKITTGLLATARGGTGVDASAAGNGKLLIGTGSGLALANITAGASMSITNTSGGITIDFVGTGGGGYTSPLTTKGDLWTYSTVNTRLAVSVTDGYSLVADSAQATGLNWAAPVAAMIYKGVWSSATAYKTNDVVTYTSALWIALANNTNVVPDVGTSYTAYTSQTPSFTNAGNVEAGCQFHSDDTGVLYGIRFYKFASETGSSRTLRLWSDSSSTLIASCTTTSETSSGWQTALFSTPPTITAGTTYRLSYTLNSTVFYSNPSAIDNGIMHIPTPQYYGNSPGTYPTTTNANNFYIDPIFKHSVSPDWDKIATI